MTYFDRVRYLIDQRRDINKELTDEELMTMINDIVGELSRENYMGLQQKNDLMTTLPT